MTTPQEALIELPPELQDAAIQVADVLSTLPLHEQMQVLIVVTQFYEVIALRMPRALGLARARNVALATTRTPDECAILCLPAPHNTGAPERKESTGELEVT